MVIFVFLPRLESNIEKQKLEDIERRAPAAAPQLRGAVGEETTAKQLDDIVRERLGPLPARA